MTRSGRHRLVGTVGLCMSAWAVGALAATSSSSSGLRPRTANAAPCEACHGAQGEGRPAASIPRLAGQSADYLEKQLRDYDNGTRDNPIMGNFAKGLNDSERAQLSAYYASLAAPTVAEATAVDAQQLARGHQLAFQGDESERVQACNNCHGPDGSGVPHSAPYLAGQSAGYLANALRAWQQGTRKNDGGQLMASVVGRLSTADIAAVSVYFAGLGTARR
jgi:cytochrome c553